MYEVIWVDFDGMKHCMPFVFKKDAIQFKDTLEYALSSFVKKTQTGDIIAVTKRGNLHD